MKCRTLLLACLCLASPLSLAAEGDYVRPYIRGNEVVGTTLQATVGVRDGAAAPTYEWQISPNRHTGWKPLAKGEQYTLTDNDAGKYLRLVVDGEESFSIGPVMTEEEHAKINNRYGDESKRYEENLAALQAELKERLKDAIVYNEGTKRLAPSPYALVRGKLMPIAKAKEASPQAQSQPGRRGRAQPANPPNSRRRPMGQGRLVLPPPATLLTPLPLRDLINEACNQLYPLTSSKKQMKWWEDAKFGMFLHWDPSSLQNLEISWQRNALRPHDLQDNGRQNAIDFNYDNLFRSFNPIKYNPKEWMQVAKKSGMEYAVLTTKHHDGFANFHSQVDNYTIERTPYKKDIVKAYSDAAHEAGIRLGYYFSGRDWYHPHYMTADHHRYMEAYVGQIEELLTKYGQVDILWFDSVGGEDLNIWDPRTVQRRIRQLQPDIIVNDRLARYRYGLKPHPVVPKDIDGDFSSPEQEIGGYDVERPWESCITVATGWSYRGGGGLKSMQESLMFLINNTVCGGNLLYNIGPKADGSLDPNHAQRLMEMGEWLTPRAQAFKGTRGGPIARCEWGGSTHRDSAKTGKRTLYLHVSPLLPGTKKVEGRSLTVEIPDNRQYGKASLIPSGKKVASKQEGNKLTLTLPEGEQWDGWDTIIRVNEK